jgi:hypothetical protein
MSDEKVQVFIERAICIASGDAPRGSKEREIRDALHVQKLSTLQAAFVKRVACEPRSRGGSNKCCGEG